MTLTVLAVIFLVIMLIVAAFGFRAIIRTQKDTEDIQMDRCSICRGKYHKSQLIERQVGDYKMLYFCASCIGGLHRDLMTKN